MKDLANLNLAVGLGILGQTIGTREGVAATWSFREARRTVADGQKIGYEKAVFDHEAPPGDEEKEALLRREAELTAELEAVRKRRGA